MHCYVEIMDSIENGLERNFDQLLIQSDDDAIDITNKGNES